MFPLSSSDWHAGMPDYSGTMCGLSGDQCQSNSTYLAINKAMDLAEKTANLPVPLHLRNAPTKLMKEQGYGVNYLYPHNYPEHFVLQDYLPPELKGTKLYESARNKREVEGERLQQRRWQQEQQQQ